MNLQSVEPTSDGGFILAGGVYGPNGGDFITIKTDSLGNEQWRFVNNQFDGDFFENYAIKAKETPDKGFIVFGDITVSLANPFDLFVAKFDSTGALKWKRQYNLDIGEFASDFLINDDTSIVFIGNLQTKSFILKTTFQGDTLWTKTLQNDSTNSTSGIKIYNWNNAYYIPRLETNYFNSNLGVLELFKIDTLGSTIWKKQYTDTARVYSLGDFYLSQDSTIVNINGMRWGSWYYFGQLNKFDLNGNLTISKSTKAGGRFINDSICGSVYGAGDTLHFAKTLINYDSIKPITKFYLYNFKYRSLIIVGDNKVVACGSAENGFSGYFGFLAVAKDTSIVGIKEFDIQNSSVKVFPNPTKNEINFEIDKAILYQSKNLILKIFDSNSKVLISMPLNSIATKLNAENFKSGNYFYVLFSAQNKIASGKIIINQK